MQIWTGCAEASIPKFNCVPEYQYQQAKGALQDAEALILQGQYGKASELLKNGLHILAYRPAPYGHDDGSLSLYVADSEEKRGRLKAAVDIRRGILKDRIEVSETPDASGCVLPSHGSRHN
jgi:hypothetical protein